MSQAPCKCSPSSTAEAVWIIRHAPLASISHQARSPKNSTHELLAALYSKNSIASHKTQESGHEQIACLLRQHPRAACCPIAKTASLHTKHRSQDMSRSPACLGSTTSCLLPSRKNSIASHKTQESGHKQIACLLRQHPRAACCPLPPPLPLQGAPPIGRGL